MFGQKYGQPKEFARALCLGPNKKHRYVTPLRNGLRHERHLCNIKFQKMKKTILVTGAAGNLGTTVVRKLDEAGYRILATLGPSGGGDTFAGLDVKTEKLDLSDAVATQSFVQKITADKTRDLAGAVLLVGGFAMGDLGETSVSEVRNMFTLNFETAFNAVKPLFEYFKNKGGGQFVLIGARPAIEPADGRRMVAYALSKSLVFELAEIINAEGKNHNVTATVLVPSTIDTPANRKSMPEADTGKWVSPEAIADAIVFLFSSAGRQLRDGVLKMYNNS